METTSRAIWDSIHFSDDLTEAVSLREDIDVEAISSLCQSLVLHLQESSRVLARLHANTILFRRDELLRNSSVQAVAAPLRAQLPNSASLFGPAGSTAVQGQAEKRRDQLLLGHHQSSVSRPKSSSFRHQPYSSRSSRGRGVQNQPFRPRSADRQNSKFSEPSRAFSRGGKRPFPRRGRGQSKSSSAPTPL